MQKDDRITEAGTKADSDMKPIELPSASIEASPVLAAVRSNKEKDLFKDGYTFKVEVYDFDSPEMKKDIENAHKEQQEILDRMKVDYDSLNKTCDI